MKDFSLLVLRVVFGGLMIFNHAMPKFEKLGKPPIKFPDPLGVGSDISLYLTLFSEGLCSVFFVLGLFSRWVSLPLLFTMGIAAFYVHLSDPIDVKEASLTYLASYLIILAFGPGKFSLDKLIRPRAKF
jgi:putative oxidoreductase